jgi:hypothetical protein
MGLEESKPSQSSRTRRLDIRWFAAFSFLIVAVHELHELAHAVTARMLCGEWPSRDFNAWHLAAPCSTSWPTAAGPLFSYAVMFGGVILAARSVKYRLPALAVIFAANPFARIFTVAMGGGDEMVVARQIVTSLHDPLLHNAVLAVVLAICGSVIVLRWRSIPNRGALRIAWAFTVLVWPMVFTGLALFLVGNRTLKAGVLATPTVGGAAFLVLLVSGAAAVLSLLTLPWLVGTTPEDRSAIPTNDQRRLKMAG